MSNDLIPMEPPRFGPWMRASPWDMSAVSPHYRQSRSSGPEPSGVSGSGAVSPSILAGTGGVSATVPVSSSLKYSGYFF